MAYRISTLPDPGGYAISWEIILFETSGARFSIGSNEMPEADATRLLEDRRVLNRTSWR